MVGREGWIKELRRDNVCLHMVQLVNVNIQLFWEGLPLSAVFFKKIIAVVIQ